jgi:hypothetical protein
MCVGVTVWFGWGDVVSLSRANHTVTPTHIEPEQYTNTQSQAPEDECTSIRKNIKQKISK